VKKYLLLLPFVVGCKHFSDISPRDAFGAYRVAVYDLGKSLEDTKAKTEANFLVDYDILVEQCKAGDKPCEQEARKVAVKKYAGKQDSYNKVRDFHKRCVEAAHIVDTLCAPGESDVCEKAISDALNKLPEVISKIREIQLCWNPYLRVLS
jgi:hypothetical protein